MSQKIVRYAGQVNLWVIFLALMTVCVSGQKQKLSAEAVLQKSADKLAGLKTVKYKYNRELNYPSEKYLAKSEAESFIDFTAVDNSLQARFQFSNNDYFAAFNGSELFSLDKKTKTIRVKNKPAEDDLTANSYLGNSPITLRNLFPQLIKDSLITKTLTETAASYIVEFSLENRWFNKLGRFAATKLDNKHIFRITIGKNDFWPTEVLQKLNETDFIKTNLSEIKANPPAPSEDSWYYSTYLSEYKFAEPPKDNLIKTGEMAHNFSLPLFPQNEVTTLSKLQGKVVLLDFWIFHCGPCQAGVPKLNALQEKYKNKDFRLLTVNAADSAKLIQLFVKKTKAKFPILARGEDVAKKYGVTGYPTVVLLGKDGKVLYSGGFDQTIVEELINRNL